MLKSIAIIFSLFVFILTIEFVNDVAPHYKTRNYIPTSATIIEQNINSFSDYTYNINLVYSYSVNGRTYLNNHIQTEDSIFNNSKIAKDFLNEYTQGKAIAVFYNPNNYRESYLFKGLTLKDWNTFLLLCGFITISLCLLFLSFKYNWKFSESNYSLPAFIFALLSMSFLAVICHFSIIFIYKLQANSQSLVVLCYLLTFTCSFVFKKITSKTLHKYYRSNMEDYTLVLHEDNDYDRNTKILELRKEGFGTVILIDLLSIMLISYIWAANQFIINNFMLYIAMFSIFVNLFYIYVFSVKPKKFFTHTFTKS